MRSNTFNFLIFLALATGLGGLFWYADRVGWLPKPVPQKELTEEEKAASKAKDEEAAKKREAEAQAKKDAEPPQPAAVPVPSAPVNIELIPLGGEGFYNRLLLSTRGGGIQQIMLPEFLESDRLGREVKHPDGRPVPLFLVPGTVTQRGMYLKEPFDIPDLKPGPITLTEASNLTEPSYTLFHYPTPEDKNPDPFLGTVNWRTDGPKVLPTGEHQATFEADLDEPYFITIRKIYTLAPKDYHVGLRIEIVKRPGTARAKFRYQISGPRGMPVDGEWYASVSRVSLVGWETPKGALKREYEDAATIAINRGGEKFEVGENRLKYAAIATQYFASALAPDNGTEKDKNARNPFPYVRSTTEVPFDKLADKNTPQFEDITFRVVCEVEVGPEKPVSHNFAIYNGPSKVRLLKLLEGDRAVDPGLVDHYLNDLGLKTITDYRSPTTLGLIADKIFWSDIIIMFTNVMHGLLYAIHLVFGDWALSIIGLTVMVRLLLFLPSRKQTQMNLRMMEVQKKLQPEIEKLKEKYKDDFHTFNREKTRLMMQNGFNPFAMMGGCLLLFAQMPIMMGLYFCLQESVFFRLEPFLWINNLSAPDMTVWWSEKIPYLSTPENVGSFYYLGPFLNVLPICAVSLMMYQQAKMMPPPTDEQMAAQQRMMKIMMIVIAVMFYKVAAGLALYFIISSLWGIMERRLIPKASDKPAGDGGVISTDGKPESTEPKPKGMLGRFKERMQQKMEELQKQAEQQSARQHRNDPNRSNPIRKDKRKRKK